MAWEINDGDDVSAALFNKRVVPPGAVLPYAGASVPSANWLMCDGSSKLRADYPDLFAAIGTQFGAADGTHFTLPDLRGKFPVGVLGSDPDFTALGDEGGEKTHTLTLPETPAHTHTVPTSGGGGGDLHVAGQSSNGGGVFTTSSQGGGGPHNNLPPFFAINFIIKI